MRPEVKDDWGIKELQNCILNIAKYIHEFCKENNIDYCIMGGSALGAVRHGGFIPWDDDLDIFMTPTNYYKFRELFNQKGNKEDFYLQELGRDKKHLGYAKLRLNNSTFIEDVVQDLDIHHGVYVDIMMLNNFPDNGILRKWVVLWAYYIEIKGLANKNYYKRGLLFNLLLRPLGWLPQRFLVDFAFKQIYKYNDKNCKNYFHLYPSLPLFRSIYPKKCFENNYNANFETIELRIPGDVKGYLSILFGDYMITPNLETIRFHQHTREWSPTKVFQKRKKGTFDDEKNIW